ncbi:MAG TPA: cob(I)yrinic acid a,c-diamide adenosyltransferase [Vicinamibacteria bacterium]|jgi:cob(I)alamin adenosyltransferase|nr:cob(I)yrinic acid a,c-diamide adenosyltransferase [Vicinamibacteria bacterium]
MSISTKRGDSGKTSLIGGERVSKGDLRVEVYGVVDELISQLGFARAISEHQEVRELTKALQRDLFNLSGAIESPPSGKDSSVGGARVEALTNHVHRIESMEGVLQDWALPGEHAAAAAFDVARTTCRRAERVVARLVDAGHEIDGSLIPYLNRLADLLWLLGRLLEKDAGANAALRDPKTGGPRWSRAW